MENSNDIRWRQRFQNFSRAYALLKEPFTDEIFTRLSQLEKEGLVQRFEYTFELSWKLFKDYLEYELITVSEATPRKIIKECQTAGIFDAAGISAQAFIDMTLARNALSHRYDSTFFDEILIKIKGSFLGELGKEYEFFRRKDEKPDA